MSAATNAAARRPGPAAAPEREAPLRVVDRGVARARRRLAPLVAAGFVVGSLLLVVIGHAELAQGQVRLAAVDAALTAAQAVHRQDVLDVGALENPSRIVSQAENHLHMVEPGQVLQVPHVSLSVPLPSPAVASAGPAPASPTPALGG